MAVLAFAALYGGIRLMAQNQVFNSGSNGSDGPLNITAPGVTYLDPKAMKLNPAGDNIFNFTTITIASGSTLKLSEAKLHGPVYFLAQGDVVINGNIDLSGDNSLGGTATAAEQSMAFAGSGGYSGGLGGIHGDPNHQAMPGNGPGGGAAGDINTPFASGGTFSTNRFLVPLIGGSGGGGTNNNGSYGAQGGAGGGALLIASSTSIRLDGKDGNNGNIDASGGRGVDGCGGSGGAIRLVANSIVAANAYDVSVQPRGGNACKPGAGPSYGLLRVESNNTQFSTDRVSNGQVVLSVPFALNLPTAPPPVITVASINGVAINANPFSFPNITINTGSAVPVVINATNVPITSHVTLYLLSDAQANQLIPIKLTGDNKSSTATVQVTFPSGGSRGFVKAVFQ